MYIVKDRYVLECSLCFFFQAEDGIRDIGVTGVQTCALPILSLTGSHKIYKVQEDKISEITNDTIPKSTKQQS